MTNNVFPFQNYFLNIKIYSILIIGGNIWKIKKTMTLIYGFCKSEIMNNVEYKIKIAIKVLKWEKRSENILEVYWIQIRASAI